MIRDNIRKKLFEQENYDEDPIIEKIIEGYLWDFLTSDVKSVIQGGASAGFVKKVDSKVAKAMKSDNNVIVKALNALEKAYGKRLDKLNKLNSVLSKRIDKSKAIADDVKEELKQSIIQKINDTAEILKVISGEEQELKSETTPEPTIDVDEEPITNDNLETMDVDLNDDPDEDQETVSLDLNEPPTKNTELNVEVDPTSAPIVKDLADEGNDAIFFFAEKELLNDRAIENYQKLSPRNKKIVIDFALQQMQLIAESLEELKQEDAEELSQIAEVRLKDFGFDKEEFTKTSLRDIKSWLKNLRDSISKKVNNLYQEQERNKQISESIRKALVTELESPTSISPKGTFGSFRGQDRKTDEEGTLEKGDVVIFQKSDVEKLRKILKSANKSDQDGQTDNQQPKKPNIAAAIGAAKSGIEEQEEIPREDLEKLRKDLEKLHAFGKKGYNYGLVTKIEDHEVGKILTIQPMQVARSKTNKDKMRIQPIRQKKIRILARDVEVVSKATKWPEKVKKSLIGVLGGAAAGLAFLATQGDDATRDLAT